MSGTRYWPTLGSPTTCSPTFLHPPRRASCATTSCSSHLHISHRASAPLQPIPTSAERSSKALSPGFPQTQTHTRHHTCGSLLPVGTAILGSPKTQTPTRYHTGGSLPTSAERSYKARSPGFPQTQTHTRYHRGGSLPASAERSYKALSPSFPQTQTHTRYHTGGSLLPVGTAIFSANPAPDSPITTTQPHIFTRGTTRVVHNPIIAAEPF
jgi:hypothetical protein